MPKSGHCWLYYIVCPCRFLQDAGLSSTAHSHALDSVKTQLQQHQTLLQQERAALQTKQHEFADRESRLRAELEQVSTVHTYMCNGGPCRACVHAQYNYECEISSQSVCYVVLIWHHFSVNLTSLCKIMWYFCDTSIWKLAA